jgi:hypothetical protein
VLGFIAVFQSTNEQVAASTAVSFDTTSVSFGSLSLVGNDQIVIGAAGTYVARWSGSVSAPVAPVEAALELRLNGVAVPGSVRYRLVSNNQVAEISGETAFTSTAGSTLSLDGWAPVTGTTYGASGVTNGAALAMTVQQLK